MNEHILRISMISPKGSGDDPAGHFRSSTLLFTSPTFIRNHPTSSLQRGFQYWFFKAGCFFLFWEPIEAKMFKRVFGKAKQEANPLPTIHKLNDTLEMLEKKEKVLVKKAAQEVEKAKQFTQAKNRNAAIKCLKRKKLYEQQIEQLGNFQLRIHDQMIMLEGANATTETVDALRSGTAVMKAMNKATKIEDLEKTMDEINDQTESMKQIQEALSAPIGAAADFDEDELEAELEELEGAELEEELLQPATSAPAAPVYVNPEAGRQPTRPAPQRNNREEDELAALQAEMAL